MYSKENKIYLNKSDDIYLRNLLKNLYKNITINSDVYDYKKTRNFCYQEIINIFSVFNYLIKGSENLPYEQNSIFIYNHLNNHPFYSCRKDFQITLDSHFISGIILYKYYKNLASRVVRCSLPNENYHHSYYNKFNYVRVYAQNFIPSEMDYNQIKDFNKRFYKDSEDEIRKGNGLVVSPEGFSLDTEQSPGKFKLGVFKLATMIKPEPKIVPIVMANFDKLISKEVFKCEIFKPFKMSDHGITHPNDPKLIPFVKNLNFKYKNYVKSLIKADLKFKDEIADLLIEKKKFEGKDNLIAFYGSSTIRLWKDLKKDFYNYNVLNFGFGGSLIKNLSENFNALFKKLSPKIIVIYMGGNDLTLELSSEQIFNEMKNLLDKIWLKFPDVKIVALSIKPSLERIKDIRKIKKINYLMLEETKNNKNLIQVDFYNKLLINEKVNKKLFLQDGLHLNRYGYEVLIKELKQLFKKHLISK